PDQHPLEIFSVSALILFLGLNKPKITRFAALSPHTPVLANAPSVSPRVAGSSSSSEKLQNTRTLTRRGGKSPTRPFTRDVLHNRERYSGMLAATQCDTLQRTNHRPWSLIGHTLPGTALRPWVMSSLRFMSPTIQSRGQIF
ncbi:unnamed protein product, partial [Ectocarpus sp. 12 AP-2014]